MDLMDKERVLNNYIDIIKAHIEGKTVLTKSKIIKEEWYKLPNNFTDFDFTNFKYKIIPEYIPFETSEEVVKNIKGRMVKTNNKKNIYYSIYNVNNHSIVIQNQFSIHCLTFKQAFNLIEFDDGEPFGKLKE